MRFVLAFVHSYSRFLPGRVCADAVLAECGSVTPLFGSLQLSVI